MGLPHKELTTFGLPSEEWLRSVSRTKKNFSARHLQSPCGLALVYHLVLRRYNLIFTGSNPDGAWSEIQHLTDGRSARPGERPAPPVELDDAEAGIWRAIAGGLPPTWLDPAAQQILARAVAQAAVAAARETQLRELRSRSPPDLDAIGALAAQHAASAKALSHLLGVLRATSRARMVSRGANRQMAQVPRTRPWEVSEDG